MKLMMLMMAAAALLLTGCVSAYPPKLYTITVETTGTVAGKAVVEGLPVSNLVVRQVRTESSAVRPEGWPEMK